MRLPQIIRLAGILALWFTACSRPDLELDVLARVGDRIITTQDFLFRAEYTPRPAYCRTNTPVSKTIILNSLIGEKLLSLAGDTIRLPAVVEATLQGRKEQAMRAWLYHRHGTRAVRVDSAAIGQLADLMGRTYRLHYLSLPSDTAALWVLDQTLNRHRTLADLYAEAYPGDTVPTKIIRWEDLNTRGLRDTLYSVPWHQGAILGPLVTGDQRYLVLEVAGWTERLAVTESQRQERWETARRYLEDQAAQRAYESFAGEIMSGHRLEFQPETFFRMARRAQKLYLRSAQEKQQALQQSLWNLDAELQPPPSVQDLPEVGAEEIFFTLDGEPWTVGRYRELIRTHPLVFRSKNIPAGHFAEEFRDAVADLIRDYFLTQAAYREGLDRHPSVVQNEAMWRDFYRAQWMKASLRQRKDPKLSDLRFFTAVIDSLQERYSDQIEIDVSKFNQLSITGIPMMVTEQYAPYPVVTPSFPQLTDDHRLNYGRRMNP
ncbi:MAG: hypothetical protein D6762_00595 [Candidatus Neomarinimicrobiota bacterium]|nr:MAG: hypothetical protein D6762_00595 [Candidatus Neomarinimicrobiota bacterium]